MKQRVFVIGASLSGITALSDLMRCLPETFPCPVFVVQHVAPHSPSMLPQILSGAGRLRAEHPHDGQAIEPGRIYVAPPDRHMLIHDGEIRIAHGPKENLSRPAIDPLFRSAAIAYGAAAVGVVLTGQLDDGTAGLLAIKDRHGLAIVQEPSEARAPSMPLSVLRHVAVDFRGTVKAIAEHLVTLANDDPPVMPAGMPSLLEVENRIAAGVFTVEDWWKIERMGTPSGLNCPDCRSALYEIEDPRLLRFRCRSGHAFSAESLLSGQAESRGSLLSSLFGALIEEATLAKRVSALPQIAGDELARLHWCGQASRLALRADEVCVWLRETAGLVEPEPVCV